MYNGTNHEYGELGKICSFVFEEKVSQNQTNDFCVISDFIPVLLHYYFTGNYLVFLFAFSV